MWKGDKMPKPFAKLLLFFEKAKSFATKNEKIGSEILYSLLFSVPLHPFSE